MGRIHLGTSGYVYKHWKGIFYPPKLPARQWLPYYARVFSTVELNNTFYCLPTPEAVDAWREQVPEGFTFACKGSRFLTHMKRLTDTDRGIRRFCDPLAPMIEAGKLGPVLWQLPDNFHCDAPRLANWLDALPEGQHAFELRHRSWWTDEIYDLLRRHNAALVVGDRAGRDEDPFVPTGDFGFVRFHYGRRGRNGNYSQAELDVWARRVQEWRRTVPLFVYFNNDWNAYAVRNAVDLRERVGM
jgi:uncharacterized protein YecE (DUF72 family)